MSTELKTKMTEHTINTFAGPKGTMVQITSAKPLVIKKTAEQQLQVEGFVQLTVDEADALAQDLKRFVRAEKYRKTFMTTPPVSLKLRLQWTKPLREMEDDRCT